MSRTIRTSPDLFVTWIGLAGGVLGVLIEAALFVTTDLANPHLINVGWAVGFTLVPVIALLRKRPSATAVVVAALGTIVLAASVTQTFGSARARIWLIGLLFSAGLVLPTVKRNKRLFAISFAALNPILIWASRPPGELLIDTIGVSVAFTMIYAGAVYQILAALRDIRRSEARTASSLRFTPIATWEQDYTHVLGKFAELRSQGVADLGVYLAEDPDRVRGLLALCRQGTISKATFDVFEVETRAEFLGPTALDTVGPGVKRAISDQMIALWNRETRLVTDVTARTFTGRRIDLQLHWAAPVVEGIPDYSKVLLSAVDLTAQKNAERRLAAEVKAKDQFVASVSHELRTPLTAVVGIAEELADNRGTISSEEAHDLIGVLAAEGRDVANIVEDLLVAARLDTGQVSIALERTDLASTFAQAATHFECAVDIAPDIHVKADPHRMRQIVRNLLTNAERYGGETVIAVGRVEGTTAYLEIRDNGAGIPQKLRASVFDPYERAEPGPGLTASVGLGLTISRSLASLMDGDLTYDYVDGNSVFTLSLPTC